MRVVLGLSGGLDSSTLLSEFKAPDSRVRLHFGETDAVEAVEAVGFRYGSKHNASENQAALNLANWYGVPYRTIDLSPFMSGLRSALTSDSVAVPEGHYEEESMRQTVVPGRNTVMVAVLASIAESLGFSHVALGIHAGDHYIYPDCRPSWFNAMRTVIAESTEKKVDLLAPYLEFSKAEIVRRGVVRNTPYHLTWTCYKGGTRACGACGSCQERLEAFHLNGMSDPISYETRDLLPKKE